MNKRRILELKFREYLSKRTTEKQVKTYTGSELEGLVTGFLLTQLNGDSSKEKSALNMQNINGRSEQLFQCNCANCGRVVKPNNEVIFCTDCYLE